MKIYLAGTPVSNPETETKMCDLFKQGHKLHSFFHCKDGFESKWFRAALKHKFDLLMDSGAYSAWKGGGEIDFNEYISFCKSHIKRIGMVVNLDVIPGKPFVKLNKNDIEQSAIQGWKNYETMCISGIPKEKIIHVFHQGESFSLLKKIVAEMDYIGLSPANDKTASQREIWLDQCMKYVLDSNGMPLVKFHGFGITIFALMFKYPWFSLDSTTWMHVGRNGQIFIPSFRKGEFDFSKAPSKMPVSVISPEIKNAGHHINNHSKEQKKILLSYLDFADYKLGKSEFKNESQIYELKENERWSGKKPKNKTEKRLVEIILEEGVSNKYSLRDEINVKYYLEVEKHMKSYPWAFHTKMNQKSLF